MDIFEIKDNNGNILKFEAVTKFNIRDSKYSYLIYRSLDKVEYYIAKYTGENIAKLDTNLTDFELKVGNEILETLLKHNKESINEN